MRSLTVKFTLAFLAVGLLGAMLVAFFVNRSTSREFDRFVIDQEQFALAPALAEYYETNGSWSDIEKIVFRGRARGMGHMGVDSPIILLDEHGQVVLGNNAASPGELFKPPPHYKPVPIKVNDQIVGQMLIDQSQLAKTPGSPEADFLTRMTRAISFSALAAIGLALLVGVLLARTLTRPIRDLIDGTRAVAQGDLGHQVAVHTDDELGELGVSFNQMSADLAQASAHRRQMTADIAHELRTPLSVILGYTEALQDGKLQGTPETFAVMHKEARHLNHLVDDLRTLALADAGELPLTPQQVAPKDLLNRTAAAHQTLVKDQGINLRVQAEDNLPALYVDPDRIAQVLGNLVANALRFTPEDGEILLQARAQQGAVQLLVQDSGVGITSEDLPHIFKRFYQGDKARAAEGESGLGLAIAKSIVEMHGGQITVESSPGEGATFIITIPVHNPKTQPAGKSG